MGLSALLVPFYILQNIGRFLPVESCMHLAAEGLIVVEIK